MADVRDRIREYWDRDSQTYDRSPSHALTDPVEAAAWRAVLRRSLPDPGARVLEAGAGTGSITALLAELGYRVTALDLSEGMLARARQKLAGHAVEFVIGSADRPPTGPFDAVVERNMLWTNPDPVGSMAAWRQVTRPGGRLLVLEGIEGGLAQSLRERAAEVVRRVLGIPHDHHDHYDAEMQAALPLAGAATPAPLLEAVRRAGWSGIRLERLRDVEWARRMAPPRILGLLETPPLFAVAAET
ncbi:MAG TPA: class I SAM-dependent methyltransferase [Actinomycetota bacterium]|jgi:SAM-dependent methyltransferase|nr:class I SAM-dependent methyltransferase [Actinomycetota bacterium]